MFEDLLGILCHKDTMWHKQVWPIACSDFELPPMVSNACLVHISYTIYNYIYKTFMVHKYEEGASQIRKAIVADKTF